MRTLLFLCVAVGYGAAETLGTVYLSADVGGVQRGGDITFTATTDEADPVVTVTFSYEGTAGVDEVWSPPYEITKTMDWTCAENLLVTATFEFENISDQSVDVTVNVVDIVIIGVFEPFRGTNSQLIARTDPLGPSVSSWRWTFDTAFVSNEFTDTANDDSFTFWPGRFVLSGTAWVSATVLGVPATQTAQVTVRDRAGIAWQTPVDCVEDNEPLWGAPLFGFNEPLGQERDRDSNVTHIIVPQSSTGDWEDAVVLSQVVSGPNAGLWYVKSEIMEIDQETVINRYMKAGGPPPEQGRLNFFDHNSAACIANMADFVQAVMNHEYRGTPPSPASLEGHFGRIEDELEAAGDPASAIEPLVATSREALMSQVNEVVGFTETGLVLFATDGSWAYDDGPNWGGEGSLGAGAHTRYNVFAGDYFPGCTFGPAKF
jgi:hypothetical protein